MVERPEPIAAPATPPRRGWGWVRWMLAALIGAAAALAWLALQWREHAGLAAQQQARLTELQTRSGQLGTELASIASPDPAACPPGQVRQAIGAVPPPAAAASSPG